MQLGCWKMGVGLALVWASLNRFGFFYFFSFSEILVWLEEERQEKEEEIEGKENTLFSCQTPNYSRKKLRKNSLKLY